MTQTTLIKIHLLGDVLDDIELRNQSMQKLVDLFKKTPPVMEFETTRLVFEQTKSQSLLRKWLIDMFVLRHNRDDFAKHVGAFPAELVQQVAVISMQQTKTISMEAFLEKTSDYLEKVHA